MTFKSYFVEMTIAVIREKPDLEVKPDLRIEIPYPRDKIGAYIMNDEKESVQMITFKSDQKNELNAKIWFGPKTAGPPGHVHGGCQAAVLDEMMGSTGWHCGYKVVAAKIEFDLLDMVPLGLNYTMKGKIINIDKRKVFIEAALFRGEKMYAKSKGIFDN